MSSANQEQQLRRAWATRAVLLLLALAVGGGFCWYTARQIQWFHTALSERAGMMLDVQEAAIAAHLRNNKYNREQLEPILARLTNAPLVVRLELLHNGEVLAGVDGTTNVPDPLVYDRTVRIDPAVHQGHGRQSPRGPSPMAGWFPFPEDEVTLVVKMDPARLEANIAGAKLQLVLSLIGTVIGFGLVLLVTEQRRRQRVLQVDLAVARERVEHHQQLSQLGAGLAHETKNPLGLVRGMAQSILDVGDAETAREQASLIIDEVDRTVRHVNAFLDLAREKEPALEDVALEDLFAGLEALVRQEALQQGVHITWAPNGCVVRADAALLRRALLNLVLNALRACDKGGEIRVVAQGMPVDGITVADNGAGIAAEDLPKVRSPYFSRYEGGTGLGLAIVDQIARAHGWRLDITSTPGKGTGVTLAGMGIPGKDV